MIVVLKQLKQNRSLSDKSQPCHCFVDILPEYRDLNCIGVFQQDFGGLDLVSNEQECCCTEANYVIVSEKLIYEEI